MEEYIIPWVDSIVTDSAEKQYRSKEYVKTKGSMCINPPPEVYLKTAFKRLHKNSKMTVGGRALCKHHARQVKNVFWTTPSGRPHEINKIAECHMNDIIENCAWKNIFVLRENIIILEMRVKEGYGMRWRIHTDKDVVNEDEISFWGFLEPQHMHNDRIVNNVTDKHDA